jgi:hypothetical protein
MAVRLWTALIVGSLATLVVLPPFAGAVDPAWMVFPGLALLAVAYWLTGITFRTMGHRRVERLLGEATVWERAGMRREVRQAFSRAAATVNSFFFSPLSRKASGKRLLAQMARFQMAQTAPESSSNVIVGAYLRSFPQDRNAAIRWLDGVITGKTMTQESHDIAARVGTAHPEDMAIQRLLAQFFLAERRCDFAALQTYRYLVDAGNPLPDKLIGDIADLFLAQPRLDSLALKVYLDAHGRGGRNTQLLPGIAACCPMISPGPLTLPLLERADAVLAGMDDSRRSKMAASFVTGLTDTGPGRPARERQIMRPAIGPIILNTMTALKRRVFGFTAGLFLQTQRILAGLRSRQAKSVVKWAAMGVSMAAVAWLVINTAMHLAATSKTVENVPAPVAAPVTDPFTLQVAAYLKETDAQRYVDQLKDQGLDAYWTRASGSSKTWYQVRVSHFPSKAAARAVGDNLRQRQLIGDYYVANYKRTEVP